MHETRDVNAGRLFLIGTGLLSLVVVVLVLVGILGKLFTLREAGPRVEALRFPEGEVRVLPPPPRLQVDPRTDLRRMRAEEDSILGGYGWVDRERGIVRIPIERAMELMLERGFPTRTGEGHLPDASAKGPEDASR